jgi:2,3-bisphosphoglycerate-independent phosphoglycerate mutase
MIIIADHGNCEMMIDPETGGPHTAHTTNLVPIIAVGTTPYNTIANGCLADVAPTLLQLMNLPSPPEMTGKTLLT